MKESNWFVPDIFAECSIDYDKNSEIAIEFYKTIQNKFHYAITGQTAAEIVYNRVNFTKKNIKLSRIETMYQILINYWMKQSK